MGMCIRMYIDGEGLRLWPVREREGGGENRNSVVGDGHGHPIICIPT